jgi:DNA-binding NarL/FixJ family response regulator
LETALKGNKMAITVVLVEDNSEYRNGMNYVLQMFRGVKVLADFSNAEDLLEVIDSIIPDVILMDIGLPGISGIEATKLIHKSYPRIKTVILTVFEDDDNVFNAICSGAIGYLTKPVMPDQLMEAVENAFDGGTPMSPRIARRVLEMFNKFAPPEKADYNLTEREMEVLNYLVQGFDYKDIADAMFISIYTVRAHIRNVYDKLHVHSKSQAVSKALKENLLKKH